MTHLELVFAHLLKFHFTYGELEEIVKLRHDGREHGRREYEGCVESATSLLRSIQWDEWDYFSEAQREILRKNEHVQAERVNEYMRQASNAQTKAERLCNAISLAVHLRDKIDEIVKAAEESGSPTHGA